MDKDKAVHLTLEHEAFYGELDGVRHKMPWDYKPATEISGFYNLVFMPKELGFTDYVAIWAACLEGVEERLRADAKISLMNGGDQSAPWIILNYALKLHSYRMKAQFLMEQSNITID